eukprot:s3174_g3.t3
MPAQTKTALVDRPRFRFADAPTHGMLASSSSSPALATSPQATRREVSVPVYEGSSLTTEFPQLVHLNVGGRKLMTTLATLQMDSDSMLGLMFSGKLPVLRDADGCFFIDRDGRQFHHILNYLRDGTLPIGLSRVDRLELLREADFYGLKALYSFIGGFAITCKHWEEESQPVIESADENVHVENAEYCACESVIGRSKHVRHSEPEFRADHVHLHQNINGTAIWN